MYFALKRVSKWVPPPSAPRACCLCTSVTHASINHSTLYIHTASGRPPVALTIANELIMMFLATNNANQCKPITQWAENVAGLNESHFASGEFAKV